VKLAKRARKTPISTPPLERLASARIIGHLRDARVPLARAIAALRDAGDGNTAAAVDALAYGIEAHAEALERSQ
jgi:hypothetical protein